MKTLVNDTEQPSSAVQGPAIEGSSHTFSVDGFGWVIAKGENGGMLKTQSVEALLLLAILVQLRGKS